MALNRQQQQAVDALGHCLVVACPGSGKTSLIVGKVEKLLGEPKAAVCVVTFTRDAADEVRKRISTAVGEKRARRVVTGTFHSLCMRQLRNAGLMGTLANDRVQRQYMERAWGGVLADPAAVERYAARQIEPTYDYAMKEIEHYKGSVAFAEGRLPSKEAAPILHAYLEFLQRNQLIDFFDLMSMALRALREGKIKPIPVNHMLVDEFQDTDEVQMAWVLEHAKAGIPITVVGDDDQSIYAFRSALGYEGMEQFRTTTGATLVTLPVNYRCRKEILDTGGAIIRHNTSRVQKDLYAHRGPGGTVATHPVGDYDGLAKALIKDMQADLMPCTNDRRFTHTVKNGTWAVLARNNQILRDFASSLWTQDVRVKHYTSGGGSPWDAEPLVFYASLLQSIESLVPTGVDQALAWAGVSDTAIGHLHSAYHKSFARNVLSPDSHFPYGKLDKDSVEILRDLHNVSPHWLIQYAQGRADLVALGVAGWMIMVLDRREAKEPKRSMYFGRMKRALDNAKSYFQKEVDQSFAARLTRLRAIPESDDELRGVGLITMHASKGLEFDNVWIIAADDDVVPGTKLNVPIGLETNQTPEAIFYANLQSERRLFYVAATRAKNRLVFSWDSTKTTSRFIREAGLQGS